MRRGRYRPDMASSRFRSYLGSARDLPSIRQRLEVLEKDHRLLLDQVRLDEDRLAQVTATANDAASRLRDVSAQLESVHRTLAEADPQLAYEIITTVRDDVRSLLVEVTEQSNRASAVLTSATAVGSATGEPVQRGG